MTCCRVYSQRITAKQGTRPTWVGGIAKIVYRGIS